MIKITEIKMYLSLNFFYQEEIDIVNNCLLICMARSLLKQNLKFYDILILYK